MNNLAEKALEVFDGVSSEANDVLYTIVFSACADLCNERAVHFGKTLLEKMPSTLFNSTVVISSAIHMLMKFGDVTHAERLFRRINQKNVVTYGAMMKGKRE
jgi:hypothetical protein